MVFCRVTGSVKDYIYIICVVACSGRKVKES